MTETEPKTQFVKSKEGVLRIVIVIWGFIVFLMVAASPYSTGALIWVVLAFLISTCLSLCTYVIQVKSLTPRIPLKIPFQHADMYGSVFCLFNCFFAAIVLAINVGFSTLRLVGVFPAIILVILYGVEIYFAKDHVPENLLYLKTKEGISRQMIFILGFTSFSLLHASGIQCFYPDGCTPARVWIFAAFIYSWSGSSLLLVLRSTEVWTRISFWVKMDLFWTAFSCLNYLVGALVLACYMKCFNFQDYFCQCRLAADIFAFVAAGLYGYNTFCLLNQLHPPEQNDGAVLEDNK